ncbi:hypothetical protein [Natrialba swarupiae]|uniref:Uncharacterized protein n=1 Tax=Natrialba swarupiae TaxID=2448032 RepID=A0A5D5ANQ6_9EURY|nr:hypothetical protein [Natrialba swarupiae]TYT61080.1 hypothetical protein FYC77_15420 [Natrialba swarupiae]
MHVSTGRRRLLASCGAGVAFAFAGCIETTIDDSSSEAIGDDAGDGTTAGADGDDPAASSDGGHNPETDTENAQSEDGEDALSVDGAEYESIDGGPPIGELVEWADSYVIDIEMRRASAGDFEGTGRQVVHQGEFHYELSMDDGKLEIYQFDSTEYYVFGGHCREREPTEPDLHVLEPERRPGEVFPETEPIARTTIDGSDVYVYEMPASPENEYWYLSTSTGYPVRFRSQRVTAEFRSWDETESISPPEMECES